MKRVSSDGFKQNNPPILSCCHGYAETMTTDYDLEVLKITSFSKLCLFIKFINGRG